jgi:hypothetical protein
MMILMIPGQVRLGLGLEKQPEEHLEPGVGSNLRPKFDPAWPDHLIPACETYLTASSFHP